MSLCTSCKNKTSLVRCTSLSLTGTNFCGKHVRVRNPRIWTEVNNVESKVILIQTCWRGYSIRNRINLAGEGCMNRKNCHNETELVTMDEPKLIHPLDYFAFIENEKLYWFDIRSIAEYSSTTLQPINPYTRNPLTIQTRIRLRRVCNIRKKLKLPIIHDTAKQLTSEQRLESNWMAISQIIEENGFFDMNPLFFIALNRTQLVVFLTLISVDLKSWASEHTSKYSRRHKYIYWLKNSINMYQPSIDSKFYSYIVSRALLSILNDCLEPYPICFILMSSLYRL
jgi:hypothetical protein